MPSQHTRGHDFGPGMDGEGIRRRVQCIDRSGFQIVPFLHSPSRQSDHVDDDEDDDDDDDGDNEGP